MLKNKINKKRGKSIQSWSWIILVVFFTLSFIDLKFGLIGYIGLFGFVCAATPIILSAIGKGRMHCSHICPRGSFFGKILSHISFKKPLPAFMKKTWFKIFLMIIMMGRFAWVVIVNIDKPVIMAASVFQFMFMSFLIGAVMGIFFTPRSWCQVCPMGQVAHYIDISIHPSDRESI